MEGRSSRFRLALAAVVLAGACARTPADLAAGHARRGDAHARNGAHREAVADYLRAVAADRGDPSLRRKLVRASLKAGDPGTALEELRKAVAIDPDDIDSRGRLGELCVLTGKLREAADIARYFVTTRPADPRGYLLLAELAARAGDAEEALRQAVRAHEADAAAVGPMLTAARLCLTRGDIGGAGEWSARAAAARPESPEVQAARGRYLFAAGKEREGEEAFRRAIALRPGAAEGLRIALAEQFVRRGRLEDGLRELEGAAGDRNSRRARKVLAELLLEAGRLFEAKAVVDAVTEDGEEDVDGKYLRGRIALSEGRLDQAMALFEEVVREDAAMARARLYKGLTEMRLGRIAAGKKEVEEAVRLSPASLRARTVLAGALLLAGDPAGAERLAAGVLESRPGHRAAAMIYGDSLLARGEWEKAERVFQSLIGRMPGDPAACRRMGLVKQRRREPAEAAAYFRMAVEGDPDDVHALGDYIDSLAASGAAGAARAALSEALAARGDTSAVWEIAGRFHRDAGSPAEAEKAFLKAIALGAGSPGASCELALALALQGRLTEAERRLAAVLEKDGKDVHVHLLLGMVQTAMGKFTEANGHYRRALALSPGNITAAGYLAANLVERGGDPGEALRYARKAHEAAPEDPRIADTLGWAYYGKGLLEEARPLAAMAAQRLPRDADVRYHLGMILLKTGRRREAEDELGKALALGAKAFRGADEAGKGLAALR